MPQYLHRVGAKQNGEQPALSRAPAPSERSVLLHRIAPWVQELVKRREPDRERQKDLYQDTMLSVWLSTAPAETPRPGLAQAMDAASLAAEIHEKQLRMDDEIDFVSLEESELRASDDPEADFLGQEASQALLGQLGQADRDILTLSVQGFSLVEIHEAIGIPRSSVQNRLEWTLRFLQSRTRIKNS